LKQISCYEFRIAVFQVIITISTIIKSTRLKTTVVTTNVIFLIILIPSIFGAMMSPMMFDAPDSEKSTKTWTLVCCLAALPVLIIIAQIVSWIAYSNQNFGLALKVNVLPVFDLLLIIFMFFIIDQFAD